jgi:hypothetical protein
MSGSTPRTRLLNGFGFGSPEHGRLGIGHPDHLRQVQASGFPVGWHRPAGDPDDLPPVALTNRRARRTHVRGLARLALLPRGVPEAAVGGNGGAVLPLAVKGRSAKPDKPFVSVATGDFHTVAVRSDGRIFGWGCADAGQLGTAPVLAAVRRAESDALTAGTRITGHEKPAEVTPQTRGPAGLRCWEPAVLEPGIPRPRRRTGLGWQEAPPDPPVTAHVSRSASFVLTKGGKVW